jgi:hypothetical protein
LDTSLSGKPLQKRIATYRFVNSVLIIRRKWCAECSNVFPEPAKFVLSIRTQARPGRAVRTFGSFLLTSIAPGITRNGSWSTAKDGGFSTNQWWCCLFLLIQTGLSPILSVPACFQLISSPSESRRSVAPSGLLFSGVFRWAHPQGDMLRLHRLLHHGQQVLA